MKIISYNINGIRAAVKKGLVDWLQAFDADVVCLQEVKATEDQVDLEAFKALGFEHIYWHAAQKKGYSGVAILSKIKPVNVYSGCDMEKYDLEGRVIRADFEDISVMNVYMPSGSSGEERQQFKFEWLADFTQYIQQVKHTIPNLIICGDFNICHQAIDIHNPKSNANSSGFLPEERQWFSEFLSTGFIDCFRYFNNNPHHYTWWSYRAGARTKNLGWRIDYHLISQGALPKLKNAAIYPDALHSDHCPVMIELH